VNRLAKSCPEVRFYFPNISWMTLIKDDNLLDQEIVEKGGFAVFFQSGYFFVNKMGTFSLVKNTQASFLSAKQLLYKYRQVSSV
jgi:hypothetical protein